MPHFNPTTLDESLALLRQIADELRLLRQLAEARQEPNGALRHHDRLALSKILPVIAAHFDGQFSIWELIDAARMRDLLGENLRLVLGTRTPQQLGKLFYRGAGHAVCGLVIRRQGQDANGARWDCVAVPSP